MTNSAPTNIQYAVATVVTGLLLSKKNNKVMVSMKPGSGKSYVIAAVAFMISARNGKDGFKKIKVVYSDERLLNAEEATMMNIGQSHKEDLTVIVTCYNWEGALTADDDTLVIFDESDFIFLDKLQEFDCKHILALTATPFADTNFDFEKDYVLRALGFVLVDAALNQKAFRATRVESLEAVLRTETDRPVIVYADESQSCEEIAR